MRLAPLALIVCMLAACTAGRPVPSSLQRLDALAPAAAAVTVGSATVAADVAALNARTRVADVGGTRHAAARLKLDALGFSRSAGNTGNQTRTLASHERGRWARAYDRLLTDALSAQWTEGRDLAALADLVWADPLLRAPQDLTALRRRQALARAAAARARWDCASAARLRHAHRAAFRYVPAPALAAGVAGK